MSRRFIFRGHRIKEPDCSGSDANLTQYAITILYLGAFTTGVT